MCGNESCGHGCCCKCKNTHCYMCKNIHDGPAFVSRCGLNPNPYPYHYICFDCKHGWKERYINSFCNYCKRKGTQVSFNTRIPKQKADKSWELLRKLSFYDELKNCPKDRLGSVWEGIGTGFHMAPHIRQLIWTPTKPRDYKRWVAYMKSTKLPDKMD